MDPADNPLADLIRATIRRDGPVRFDWFMEQALYHPRLGYYSSGQCRIGRRGDYFTNVSVGPLFGRMLARQFFEMWELLDRPRDFTIVEQGADGGDFAKDVLEAAREQTPEFFAALRYCIVEPFPILQNRQEEKLREFAGRITSRKAPADLEPFTGVHFSNELIDSIPVRLISRESGQEWMERFVTPDRDRFAFTEEPIVDKQLRDQLSKIPAVGNCRYETEVNLAALDWVEAVAGKLQRGFFLAVDYGYSRAAFYAPERTTGTLQAFAQHRTVSSPLLNVGRVDITAHVEWTSLAECAEEIGLTLAGFTDQHHFMTGMLSLVAPGESDRRALQTLLHPEFLGTRFQYLALAKNVSNPGLTGFRLARDARKALFD